MKVIYDINEVKRAGMVLSIGNFDGVHTGHQQLLATAKAIAKKYGTELLAMTFDPHPAAILHPDKLPGVLTPGPLKRMLLEENGVDELVIIRDSYSMLSMSPKDFADEFLMKQIKPRAVVEGHNFTFGYGRSGNVDMLAEMGKERGFEVVVAEPKQVLLETGEVHMASSTLVRHVLEQGRVGDASIILGRPYKVIGKIVSGRGKGREIGFPTANLEPTGQIIPDEGVYAGFVSVGENIEDVCRGGKRLKAAISIGRAKTFVSDHPLLFEAHVLEGEIGDLYGKWMGVDFIEHIRSQQRFESIEALKVQIAKDCGEIMSVLERENSNGRCEG